MRSIAHFMAFIAYCWILGVVWEFGHALFHIFGH
jgi:hypothetical protein